MIIVRNNTFAKLIKFLINSIRQAILIIINENIRKTNYQYQLN